MPAKRKRVVAISDLHCGHVAGLTPPAWTNCDSKLGTRFAPYRTEAWAKYMQIVKRLRPIDVLIVNGDMIHGKGERSGGVELLESDRIEQAMIAAAAIRVWRPTLGYVLLYGTPSHTGKLEDFEDIVGKELGTEVHSHAPVDVNGVIFDCKHKIGGSSIPHGRLTQIQKAKLWNHEWAELGVQPRADIFLRGHVHYNEESTSPATGIQCVTLPALSGWTKFGARQCDGVVHWGVNWWDINDKGERQWHYEVEVLQSAKEKLIKL